MEKIQSFFRRIGMNPDTIIEQNVDFLGKIQLNCVLNIAYENLDILANKPISLAPDALYDKIVVRGRGGYCFELNGLLTYMLREMGFRVSERFARVLRGEPEIPMRRHRVTVVHMADGDYLCDIGVGMIAPRLPLRIAENIIQEQNGETYRFTRDARHGWVLWDLHHDQWREYLCFNDDAVYDIDFIQPSFFCEKHPDSPFNKHNKLAIKTEAGRRTIDGRCYKEFHVEELVHIEEDLTDERLHELFVNEFKLSV
jgi:N-hydroxyarylamine O-acetyltransferase